MRNDFSNANKLIVLVFVCLMYVSSCQVISGLCPLSAARKHQTLMNYYSDIQDSSDYINGVVKYLYDKEIWQVEAQGGYILSNSKKCFKDTILVVWKGEDYVQKRKLSYNDLFIYDYSLTYEVLRNNFEFRFSVKGGLSSVYINTDTNHPRYYTRENFFLSYYNRPNVIRKAYIYSQQSDTIIDFKRNETVRKMVVLNRKSGETEHYGTFKRSNNGSSKFLDYYNAEHLKSIVNEVSTDYKMPVIEPIKYRPWKKMDN